MEQPPSRRDPNHPICPICRCLRLLATHASRAPPAALFYASRDRAGEHPERHLRGFCGILQADAYSGYNRLYDPARPQGVVTPALCWAHARRQFFVLADIAANARRGKNAAAISPLALEVVRRLDLCLRSSASSTAFRLPSGCGCDRSRVLRWSQRLRPGCGISARACRVRPRR